MFTTETQYILVLDVESVECNTDTNLQKLKFNIFHHSYWHINHLTAVKIIKGDDLVSE